MPVFAIGLFLGAKFRQGMRKKTGDQQLDADLLAGDAIINYRTVASFANEEVLVAKYEEILQKTIDGSWFEHQKAGIAFGFSQWSIMCTFSALFYAGGIIQNHVGDLDPANIF